MTATVVASFPNGNKLRLDLRYHSFAGYNERKVFCICYLSKENSSKQSNTYYVLQSEYFPWSEETEAVDYTKALTAFTTRLQSPEPHSATCQGPAFDEVFVRHAEQCK